MLKVSHYSYSTYVTVILCYIVDTLYFHLVAPKVFIADRMCLEALFLHSVNQDDSQDDSDVRAPFRGDCRWRSKSTERPPRPRTGRCGPPKVRY